MVRLITDDSRRYFGFWWEDPSDRANVVSIFVNDGGGLSVGVSEEKAMDSYNVEFECHAFLTRDDAIRLRDYLNVAFGE